jgi:hypothetical protein
MKKLSRIALIALVLILAIQSVGLAVPVSNVLNGTWTGTVRANLGGSTVSATLYITCKDGAARFRAAGKTKLLTYTINGDKLIVTGSLYGVTKTPEFKFSLANRSTILRLSNTTILPLLPASAKLSKTYAKVSKVSASQPRVGRARTVGIYTSGATEYVYLAKADGTVVATTNIRTGSRFNVVYAGWVKGYNTLYAYAGLYDANGNRPVVKTVGQVLTPPTRPRFPPPSR